MQLPISQITLGVSSYGFRDVGAFLLENSLFSPSYLCLTPPSRGTPCDNNVICTSLESKFNGLQFCRCQYRSIFIHLAVVVFVVFQIYEISRNSKRIWVYSTSRSSKVIDLGVNWKSICDFLLVIWPYLLPFSEILTFKARKRLVFPPPPSLTPPPRH